jgi:hypothetical protein
MGSVDVVTVRFAYLTQDYYAYGPLSGTKIVTLGMCFTLYLTRLCTPSYMYHIYLSPLSWAAQIDTYMFYLQHPLLWAPHIAYYYMLHLANLGTRLGI